MDQEDVRRIALSLPQAEEKSHFGKPDFRVRDHVFATLPPGGKAVVKLTLGEQEVMCQAEPDIFKPVNGAWGRQGWTEMTLAEADEATLKSGLITSWRNVAPAALRKTVENF